MLATAGHAIEAAAMRPHLNGVSAVEANVTQPADQNCNDWGNCMLRWAVEALLDTRNLNGAGVARAAWLMADRDSPRRHQWAR